MKCDVKRNRRKEEFKAVKFPIKRFPLKFLKNARGQVAIFVVLIFQVLFILFAMTINIALVTYDKINLQNSLDLAVYYGAKKQAEVLNAMAHINYQMRQNWKLLAWRYRMMGTLVQYEGGGVSDYWCPQNKDSTNCINNLNLQCQNAQNILDPVYGNSYCDAYYFVCISHNLWKRGVSKSDQNLCIQVGVDIPPVTNLQIVAGFMAEAHLAAGGVDKLQKEVAVSCPAEGALNWLMTQFFMTHFRLDQKDRKVMLQEIYNRTLKEGKDLEGESLFEGAKQVFYGNLTKSNQENVKGLSHYGLQEFNSFEGKEFKDIFEKLNVWPVLQFLYSPSPSDTDAQQCEIKNGLHFTTKALVQNNQSLPIFDDVRRILSASSPPHSLSGYLDAEIRKLFAFNREDRFVPEHNDPLRDLTLSFFKKKDQTLYYGLSLEFDYQSQNQIFSLSVPLQFKASAFAKAFGASFGPQPGQSDPLIPVHHALAPSPIPNSQQLNPALLQPNHSRFPGDKWGLIDRRLHDNRQPMNFLNKHKHYNGVQSVYTMEDYFHLIFYEGPADDPLARNPSYDPYSFTRMMELMAIYPDLYDISYYSILGNYHQTYFKKICQLLKGSDCDSGKRNKFSSSASNGRAVYIRGDFGWPDTKQYLERNYSEKSVELSIAPYFLNQSSEKVRTDLINLPPNLPVPGQSPKDDAVLEGPNWPLCTIPPCPLTQGNLFYPWLARSGPDKAELPAGLLSSWTNPLPLNYENYDFPDKPFDNFPEGRFLQCPFPAEGKMPVPSACAAGGRSGYSVKLISCETVKDFDLKPDNIDAYCPN